MPENPPLSGIKVVDFTRYLAGPFCTQILGDYGAEILKVEPVQGARGEMGDESGKDTYFFLSTNRSKKSVQISTKAPEGRAVLQRLLDRADVVIDNFRPGVMEALGFGYDQIAQGFSGLMSVTGTAASGPTRVGIAICDLLGGIYAAQGILLALEARHRTGRGQRVETSLLEAIVSTLAWSAGIYFDTGKTPGPAGNHHPLSSPHGVFMAADRPFNIAVGNEAMWRTFVKVIGRAELGGDERFNKLGRRIKNREALTTEINAALKAHPAEHWMGLFNEAGIPSGPILTIEEMFNHPQAAAREMLVKMAHPGVGEFKTTGLGVKLGDTPGRITRPPLVGEHTEEVLMGYGYTAAELAQLREIKAIR